MKKYIVKLAKEERADLSKLIAQGKHRRETDTCAHFTES